MSFDPDDPQFKLSLELLFLEILKELRQIKIMLAQVTDTEIDEEF